MGMTEASMTSTQLDEAYGGPYKKRIAELEADLLQATSALLEIRDSAVLMPNGAAWSAGVAALCVGTMKSKQS